MASTRVNSGERRGVPWTARVPEQPLESLPAPGSGTSAGRARPISSLAQGTRLAGLKWRLLSNTLTRSTWVLVGTIFGGLYILGLLGLICSALFMLGAETAETVRTFTVLTGVLLLVGWWLAPVVTSRADASLDPSRLALFPLSVRGIQIGQVLGAVIGIPGAATVLTALAWVSAWRGSVVALVTALPCAAFGVLLAYTGSRTVTALAARLSRNRRSGEIISVLMLALLVGLGPIITVLSQGIAGVWDRLPGWASVLAWTPLGAVWAVPGDVGQGHWGAALARTVIALVTVGVLLAVWQVALRRALSDTTGDVSRSGGTAAKGAGLLDRLPATGWGAVMARCLIYWFKDPRYAATVTMIPVLGAILWFTTMRGTAEMMWLFPMLAALLLAYSISADVAFDNTAFSLHILASVKGTDDRLGRVLALLTFGVPLVVIALAVSVIRTQAWTYLLAMTGVCAALLLAGSGVVSILSARYTYPVPPPGASPMKTPQGFTILNVLMQFVTMGVIALLALPAAALAVTQLVTGDALWGWLALAMGLVEGFGLLWLGVVRGGRWLEARAPELLQEVAQYR